MRNTYTCHVKNGNNTQSKKSIDSENYSSRTIISRQLPYSLAYPLVSYDGIAQRHFAARDPTWAIGLRLCANVKATTRETVCTLMMFYIEIVKRTQPLSTPQRTLLVQPQRHGQVQWIFATLVTTPDGHSNISCTCVLWRLYKLMNRSLALRPKVRIGFLINFQT